MRFLCLSLLALLSCSQPPPHAEGPDLRVQVDPVSTRGVCCFQAGADRREPRLRLDLLATECLPGERQVRRRQCDSMCCLTPGGVSLVTMSGLCEARGGWPGDCPAEGAVCCRQGKVHALVHASACAAPGEPVEMLACDLVCCSRNEGTGWLRQGACLPEGKWLEPRMCDQDAGMSASGM